MARKKSPTYSTFKYEPPKPEYNVWKDVSSYSRQTPQEERVPDQWDYETPSMRISVHRHIHYEPDQWLMSVRGRGAGPRVSVDMQPLKNKDADQAKAEALTVLKTFFAKVLGEIESR